MVIYLIDESVICLFQVPTIHFLSDRVRVRATL